MSPSRETAGGGPGDRWLPYLLLALFLLGAWRALGAPGHHDLTWYLFVAERVLHGAVPYVDVLEVNPPLVLFLTLPVRALADALGASPRGLLTLVALVAVGGSLLLSCRLLRRLEPGRGPTICLVAAFLLVVWPGAEFGQREHLVAAFVLPYLLAAALRTDPDRNSLGNGEALLCGAMAGMLALKPFYALLWPTVELYVARRAGWRAVLRPETAAFLATQVAYLLAVLLFTPAYLSLARDALSVYPGYWPSSPWLIATHSWQVLPVALALATLALGWSKLDRVLAVATVFFTATVFLQNKGWFYHWIPAVTTAGLLLAAALARVAGRRARGMAAVLGVLLVAAGTLALRNADWSRMARHPYYLPEMLELADEYAQGGVISALSTKVQTGFPLAYYADAEWGLSMNALWFLPGLYPRSGRVRRPFPYHTPDSSGDGAVQSPLEQRFFNAVVEDITRRPPDMLIVDRYGPGPGHRGFDFMEYFSQSPRFRALAAGYRVAAEVGDYAVLVPAR